MFHTLHILSLIAIYLYYLCYFIIKFTFIFYYNSIFTIMYPEILLELPSVGHYACPFSGPEVVLRVQGRF